MHTTRETQMGALEDLLRLGMVQSAEVLATLLPRRLELKVATVTPDLPPEVRPDNQARDQQLDQVMMSFNGSVEGDIVLAFERTQALALTASLFEPHLSNGALDSLESGALSEVANIVLNGATETLAQVLDLNLIYQVPSFRQGNRNLVHPSRKRQSLVTACAPLDFHIEPSRVRGYLILFLEAGAGLEILERAADRALSEPGP